VFAYFESRIRPTARAGAAPPPSLVGFYWHFVRQSKGLYAAMFATGLTVALVDTAIPVFIGKLVRLMEASDRAAAFTGALPMLIGMALVVLVLRPTALLLDSLVRNNAVVPGVTSLIRWQSHWHVVRQSWPFFQNDFAGRIANRVMQTSNAVRESVVSSIRAVWYIGVYGLSALVLMSWADWRLAVPTALWFAGYVVFLRHFVPKMRDLAKNSSELRSLVMGRVVDSYTNILTVKLFARARDEDAYVREVIDEHTGAIAAHMRLITKFMTSLSTLNALLLVSTAAIGITLWAQGRIDAGTVATALPLAWTIANVAGWVSWEVTGIFENIGVVQEGMETIAVPHAMHDRPDARALAVSRGEVRFEHVNYTYGRSDGKKVLDDLTLTIRPGERVGVVGRSGADAPVLVLDEATSALDSEVELAIQEQLLGLMEGKTVIAIAHRLSTIARMDRLIVLDEGRIVEQGTHAELIAKGPERGHYAKLWAHQSGGFLAEAVAERTGPDEVPAAEEGPLDEMRTAERPEPDVDAEPPVVKA
jgi:ATP-binding cassette subfamily B multidrug efflux pump